VRARGARRRTRCFAPFLRRVPSGSVRRSAVTAVESPAPPGALDSSDEVLATSGRLAPHLTAAGEAPAGVGRLADRDYRRRNGSMAIDLTIIVPAFNEAQRLVEGFKRFDDAVADGAVDLERTDVMVVDDGSSDETAETARGLVAHLPHHRVITLPANGGKGAAVRTGVRLARSPLVAYMDADMAIDPRAVPSLLEALESNEAAIGSRALTDSMVDGTYAVRAVMGRLFNRLVTTGTGLDLQDTQCGFKAFHTPAARLLFHLVPIDRFAFDVELLARARRLGLRITEVPVQWKNVPGSTIHPLHDSVAMLRDVYRSRFGLLATPPVTASWCVGGPGARQGGRCSRSGLRTWWPTPWTAPRYR
jgi:dolichyl-phosphate beta-glucosyltransferase